MLLFLDIFSFFFLGGGGHDKNGKNSNIFWGA